MSNNTAPISKIVMDDVLSKYNVYTNKYDAQNKTNAVSGVAPQWWGDQERPLELDLETGIVWETQEDGTRVGMGAFDEDGIKALTIDQTRKARNEENLRKKLERDEARLEPHPSERKYDGPTSYEDAMKKKLAADEEKRQARLEKESKPNLNPHETSKPEDWEVKHKEETPAIKKVGATAGTFGMGVLEGLTSFGETLVDAADVIGTGIATVGTAAYDGIATVGQALTTHDTLAEAWEKTKENGVTANMWDETMGFVAHDYSTEWFDSFYEGTSAGQWLKENAYG